MSRVTKNLPLDSAAVERYRERDSTNLSEVVSDPLSRLATDEGESGLSPTVRG